MKKGTQEEQMKKRTQAKEPKKGIRICSYDSNSVSLFDINRHNEFGELYCVAPAILESEVEDYWSDYIVALNEERFTERHGGDIQA